ncbi:uncharacterized protein N7498_001162 [Penicillium cinerascens]|uniref:Uncharacterized protein n=1 Tax=Penicillium cinerascens TaxID=70096 RepID=A0A9W9TDS5_9EURO|nr:uncharacterized protein N7498_001162 [Penicillium cinerascens]KAJ5219063.1 hypothetical protein N7498_001162 [Penicillium cinerascens]
MLTWREIYCHSDASPGQKFAGTVANLLSESAFKPHGEVFGMAHADRGSMWAECVVLESEIELKPSTLTWEEATAWPLSAQAAFEAPGHAGVLLPDDSDRKVLRGQDAMIASDDDWKQIEDMATRI